MSSLSPSLKRDTVGRRPRALCLLILGFLISIAPVAGQTVLTHETFAGSGLPAGWQLVGGSASVSGGQLTLNGCIKLPGTYSRSAGLSVEADVTVGDYFWFYVFGSGSTVNNCFPDFGYGLGHVIQVPSFPGTVYLFTRDGSGGHSVASAAVDLVSGNTYHSRVDFSSTGRITTYFNRQLAFTAANNSYSQGNLWLVSQATARIDNLLITANLLPAAPANLSVTPTSTGVNSLTWTDNSNNETGFRIERRTGSGIYSQIATRGPNVSFFTDSGLLSATQYCYRIRATNATDDSAYSNESCATPSLSSPLHHFSFSSISSPQAVGAPFTVTITARTDAGAVVPQDFDVALSASLGQLAPIHVKLQQGTATVPFTLDAPGAGTSIAAYGEGMTGQSNVFDVTGGPLTTGVLSGFVRAADGSSLAGATVSLGTAGSTPLSAGDSTDTRVTDSFGRFEFTDKLCQSYNISAITGGGLASKALKVEVVCGKTITADLLVSETTCNPAGLTPVLLVPGMLGSATIDTWVYPALPVKPPSAWNDEAEWGSWQDFNPRMPTRPVAGLYDPFGLVGWREVVDALHAANPAYTVGCTIFPVPYDWRMPVDQVVERYLIPAIDFAKNKAGAAKVHVVAHSMGGLVTRAYIQSESYPTRSDIDRFAMVGTPNLGSAKALFLWQGGDPDLADELADDFRDRVFKLYTHTSRNLFFKIFGRAPSSLDTQAGSTPSNHQDMAYLYHTKVPSLRQLEPAWSVLDPNGYLTCPPRGNIRWNNDWLDMLNGSPHTSRMVPENGPATSVRTKIFAGTGQPTIYTLRAGSQSCNSELYPDGRPLVVSGGAGAGNVVTALGDGTVPLFSAYGGLGSEALGAHVSYVATESGSHGSLVKTYKCQVLQFLLGASCSTFEPDARTAEVAPGLLSVRVLGRPQPYVSAPGGDASGIDPATGTLETAIDASSVIMKQESGTVAISAPPDGVYSVELSSVHREDYELEISYQDETNSEITSVQAFYWGSATVSFTFDSASTPKIAIHHSPLPPTGLQANPTGGGAPTTRLSWNAHDDPLVTNYNVYRKLEGDPKLAWVATRSATTFDTADSWAGQATDPVRIYTVSAVYANGSESFLAPEVMNNDRDHDDVKDADEIRSGTSVVNPDSDGDGLTDGAEVLLGGNPLLADTDGDGVADGQEVTGGSDPLNPASTPGLSFFTVPPCRLIDTRGDSGSLGGPVLTSGSTRLFPVTGTCGIPDTARALSVNITAVSATGSGNLRVYPGGIATPTTSAINFTAGLTRANSAVVPLSGGPEKTIAVTPFVAGNGQVHFILDVNGYFTFVP